MRSEKSYHSCSSGVTLIEILVISTIATLLAALSFPTLQLFRQREKENRLRESLNYLRWGIGIGEDPLTKYAAGGGTEDKNRFPGSGMVGYRNFIIRKLEGQVEDELAVPGTGITDAEFEHVLKSETVSLYPSTPTYFENPLGLILTIFTNDAHTTETEPIFIQQRFIRKIPEHPFKDWVPEAHWEFKAYSDGNWYSESAWGGRTGVVDVRSAGAGYAIDGTNTDGW